MKSLLSILPTTITLLLLSWINNGSSSMLWTVTAAAAIVTSHSSTADALVSPKASSKTFRSLSSLTTITTSKIPKHNNKSSRISTSLSSSSSSAMEVPPGGSGGSSEVISGTGTATIPNEVFNLIKSIVGAGVLSLPYGVAAFGNAPSAIIPAIFLISFMGILSAYTFSLIGRICQKTNTSSYSDAWDVTVGTSSSWLIAFSCFIDCFAGNLSYSMILADTIKNLALSAGIVITRTNALLGVTLGILTPLCFLKNLASLAPFSLVGIIGTLYTAIAMGIRWYGKTYQIGGTYYTSQLTSPIFGTAGAMSGLSFNALILACMLSNAYIAHFNAPKFLKELKNNTQSRFNQVIAWSFGASIAIYATMTSFGFLTFGGASNGLILNNYSTKDVIASLCRIAVAVSVTFSFPLIFVGTRDGLLDFFKIKEEKRTNDLINKYTIGLLIAITALASKLTDLGLVASIGGATFGTALVYVYPIIMFLKLQNGKYNKETIPAALIGVLGLVMGVIGTVFACKGL